MNELLIDTTQSLFGAPIHLVEEATVPKISSSESVSLLTPKVDETLSNLVRDAGELLFVPLIRKTSSARPAIRYFCRFLRISAARILSPPSTRLDLFDLFNSAIPQ